MEAYRKQRFIDLHREYFGTDPEVPLTDIHDIENDIYRICNDKFELIWKKFARAKEVCSAIPLYGNRFDDPMTEQEYFLIEINQYEDGIRTSRHLLHYNFIDWMHMLPYIKNGRPS